VDALLRVEAREELRQAALWYEEQQSRLGGEFLDDFLVIVASIEENPELYVEVDPHIRRALLRRFPYALFYSIEPTHIRVLAVKHCQRDPAKWPSRT
jgi:plasmid stabilization system protein ParE